MTSIVQRIYQITSLVRASRALRWEQVPPVRPDAVSVIYHRPSPLWARWASVIVALDVMMVTSIIEYTWDISGLSSRNKIVPAEKEKLETTGSEGEILPMYLAERMQTQAYWKKTLFSGVFVISGILCGTAILASRARLLRTVTFVKPGPGPNPKRPGTLYLQTASHPVGYGVPMPVKDCSMVKTKIPSRLVIRVHGLGGWLLDLKGATINGQKMPKDNIDGSRVAMLRAWNAIGGRIVNPAAQI